jgi:hypothetical protein
MIIGACECYNVTWIINAPYLGFTRRFLRYVSRVRPAPFKSEDSGVLEMDIESGRLTVLHPIARALREILYRFFSGHGKPAHYHMKQHILYDGLELERFPSDLRFIYICRAEMLPPDIRVDDFTALVSSLLNYSAEEKSGISFKYLHAGDFKKQVCQLTAEQAQELMTTALQYRRGDVYFIDELTAHMGMEFTGYITARMKGLTDQGAAVVYLTTLKMENWTEKEDVGHHAMLDESSHWVAMVLRASARLSKTKGSAEKGEGAKK